MPAKRHGESPDNNPPAIRQNSDGRITNIDEIIKHVAEYNHEELKNIRTCIGEGLIQARGNFQTYMKDAAAHVEQIMGTQKDLQENRLGLGAELWNTEEIMSTYAEEEESLVSESVVKILVLDDLAQYVEDLCTLGEEVATRLRQYDAE